MEQRKQELTKKLAEYERKLWFFSSPSMQNMVLEKMAAIEAELLQIKEEGQ